MNEFDAVMKAFSDGLRTLAIGIESVAQKIDEMARNEQSENTEQNREKQTSSRSAEKPKPVKQKPVKIKKSKKSASEIIMETIEKHGGSITLDVLRKETKLKNKTVQNTLYKLKNKKKIKSERKGYYEII
jgi:predicted Rossmann fold nucleotide-binding protein DprA/Smf involved in DNA uptake